MLDFKKISFLMLSVAITLLCACGGKASTDSENAGDDESGLNGSEPPKSYRAGIPPTGSFEVKIERLPLKYRSLKEISDFGDFLFHPEITSSRYSLVKNGIETEIKSDSGLWPVMLPNGKVVLGSQTTMGTDRYNSYYPFGQACTQMFHYMDQSFLAINIKNVPGEKKPTYILQREWHRSAASAEQGKSKDSFVRSEPIYTAHNPLILLEKTETDVIWIRDHNGSETKGSDNLVRIEGGQTSLIAMPNGYANVQRLCQTGPTIAATFGIIKGSQPFRSFVRQGNGWKELPIPNGFDFSFVQKVFTDGSILGYVTNANVQKIRNVLWRDDRLAILDDSPGWPKSDAARYVSHFANRNGIVALSKRSNLRLEDDSQFLMQITSK
jgi:hypothetical protein